MRSWKYNGCGEQGSMYTGIAEAMPVCVLFIEPPSSWTAPNCTDCIRNAPPNAGERIKQIGADRFARNIYDSATYKSRLKKNGVKVLSARENITDDAPGVLMESVLEINTCQGLFSIEYSRIPSAPQNKVLTGFWRWLCTSSFSSTLTQRYIMRKCPAECVIANLQNK